jgi:hypothetical protein
MSHDQRLDDRQCRVVKALDDRSPRLAGVYRSALSTLRSEPESGCEAARVSMICHCMRELMTGLPAAMADTAIPRPKPSSGSLVAKLPELLANHPDVDLGIDQDIVPVPKKVAQALASLVTTVTQEQGRNRSNAAALVTDGSDPKHPAIKQWLDAYEFFVGWAHLDRNHERDGKLPGNEELLAVIRVVEDVIDVRTTVFFENLHAVEDLLASANAANGEV